MKKTKKRKQKWRWMKYRRGDVTHNLMCATQRWVHANGGTSIVMGGIGILDEENVWVAGSKGKYRVCIGVLGIKPKRLLEKEK